MMVESMNEGAVTLIPAGTIFYCNPRFSEMVQIDIERLIATNSPDVIFAQDRLGLMGCNMKVTSSPDQGTQVRIEIPIERKSA